MNQVQEKTGVYLLTVHTPEGYEIVEYYGLVTGHAIEGTNLVRDWFAKWRDKFGGRVGGYEAALQSCLEHALYKMAVAAHKQGANAVVGVEIDTSTHAANMLLASCSGTAVKLRPVSGHSRG